MSTLPLRKFNDLYDKYGLGAVKNLHVLLQTLILGRTCSLWKLKDYVGLVLGNEDVQPASHYRRLIRFFEEWHDSEEFLVDLQQRILRLLKRFRFTYLLLDGTSWKRGGQKYHYMVLSVLVGDVAVPIYWKQLSKIGASSQAEREELFEQATSRFDLSGMTLLADREYIGKKWFNYLETNKIPFVIRLRFINYYHEVNAAPGKSYQEMYDQCRYEGKFCRKQIEIKGKKFYLSMRHNPKQTLGEEVIIFLTIIRPLKKTVDQYIKRWRIECLFRHLKSNGFGLEDLNLRAVDKSNLLMAIVCLAYSLTIRVGWAARSTIRKIQYADGSSFPAESIFRKGLSLITPWCANLEKFLYRIIALDPGQNHPIVKNV
ncbi:transposase [Neolewinella antarctica]|uniref:transposase n=1 Tax=Neolewinella antarctica TaxID=442734 RepID=UPI00143B5CA2|nr:transposase [Neolewinella antarctica]